MDGIINFQLFIITSTILIMAPGPDFIYVTTRGIADGNRAGVLSAFGISAGLLVHTLFAALGLSAVIQTSRVAYLIIKYLGAAYLLFLGIKSMLSKSNGSAQANATYKPGSAFQQGILTNVFNPKAIITFMAFLPQFVRADISHPIFQFTLLGLTLAVIAAMWFAVVGYFAGFFGNILRQNRVIQQGIKYVSGSVMILLGLRLAIKRE